MGVIVIGLGTSRSVGEKFGCMWERLEGPATNLGALATSLGAPVTSFGVPTTSFGAPATTLEAPLITVEQFGKNNIFFGCHGARRYEGTWEI